jgi:uncharacterized protein (TIGR00730 family)
MKKLCVFCGSAAGNSDYMTEARRLGAEIAKSGMGLVYGGASIGLMGAFADGALSASGEVHGVIPRFLGDREIAHAGLTELHYVDSMHERKQLMYDLSDGFLAFPGGMGTLDELCEIVTWAQLKKHDKPCYLYNYNGFFDGLIAHFKKCTEEGFLSAEHLKLVRVCEQLPTL